MVSGPSILATAAVENVKTWRFENPYAVVRKYETIFRYRLSGEPETMTEVPHSTSRNSVTFESFHEVDVVSSAIDFGLQL